MILDKRVVMDIDGVVADYERAFCRARGHIKHEAKMKIGTLFTKDDILRGITSQNIQQFANYGIDFIIVDIDPSKDFNDIERIVGEIQGNKMEADLIFSPTWRNQLVNLVPTIELVQKMHILRIFVRIYEGGSTNPDNIVEILTRFVAAIDYPLKICIYGALTSPNMPTTALGRVFIGLQKRIGAENLFFSPLLSWKTLGQSNKRGYKQTPGVFIGGCSEGELTTTLDTLDKIYNEAFLFPYMSILGHPIKDTMEIGNTMVCIRSTAIRSSPSMGASILGRLKEGDRVNILEILETDRRMFGKIEDGWIIISIGSEANLKEI